jgi:hypothetical protein
MMHGQKTIKSYFMNLYFSFNCKNQYILYEILLQCIMCTICLHTSTTSYFEPNCAMLYTVITNYVIY